MNSFTEALAPLVKLTDQTLGALVKSYSIVTVVIVLSVIGLPLLAFY